MRYTVLRRVHHWIDGHRGALLHFLEMVARAAAVQAQHDSERQANPRIVATFSADVERYTALSEKFERAKTRIMAKTKRGLLLKGDAEGSPWTF